ncbi:DUF4870 domain-containing protein [Actinomadura logoneensis]|uniref:DUF4870 domain-containing protein n=1 Tax=Actinomadura logoneensis TaxID=2293572 RepID=A0A372JCS1_9ACTN|nr:DUF4870 domain-containing protein [Actinomadura logoneensis]RFU37811.1 DUF4870 domain-containing protein [Actinomadura logoneensis]
MNDNPPQPPLGEQPPGEPRPPSGEQPPPYGPPPHAVPYGSPYGGQGGPPPPYDPRYGYGPPGVPQHPSAHGGAVTSEETNMVVLSYVLMLFVGFLAPLVIYLMKKNTSRFVRHHAAQALNYQLTMLIHLLALGSVCAVPAIITKNPAYLVPLVLVYLELLIGGWVFPIVGAVSGGKGRWTRFPTFFCFRMIR